MNGDTWAVVGIAAAIATALSTGVSTVAALWWRRHDRQEADWVFYDAKSDWRAPDRRSGLDDHPASPHGSATLANAGDGAAFRFRVHGRGCRVELQSELKPSQVRGPYRERVALVPVMAPGAVTYLQVWAEPSDWERALVVLTWVRSPTWRKRGSARRLEVRLPEVCPRPGYRVARFDEESGTTHVEVVPDEPPPPVLPERLRADEPLPGPRRRLSLPGRR